MTQRTCGFLVALMAFVVPVLPASPAAAHAAAESYAELVERLTPSVVSIATETRTADRNRQIPDFQGQTPFDQFFRKFFERYDDDNAPRESRPVSLGSGFVVSPDGHVVTNAHVIDRADKVLVRLDDGTEYEAEVVATDPKTDIAVLKVDPDGELPAVTFGDSDVVRVGDAALAIGNPFGFGNSVTAGIISARQRDINAGPYDDFLQTDAPINRGNSGGPLFNADGEVIGVNTLIFTPSGGSVGIGFAVPSNIVSGVVDQLIEYGRTRRGWLGVRIQNITPEIAEAFDLPSANGALVASVTPDGPAEEAGLEAGDAIVRFNGIEIEEMRELPRVVAQTEVGRDVEVIVVRDGREVGFSVVLGELEEFERQVAGEPASGGQGGNSTGDSATGEILGMTIRPLTPDIARQYRRGEDETGLIVTDIVPDSPAQRAGLEPGDVVMGVGKTEVETVEQVSRLFEEAAGRDARSVIVRIDRAGNPQFLAVQIEG